MKMENIAATVTTTIQTGMDEYSDFYETKVFPMTATLQEIEEWAKTHGKGNTIFHVNLSLITLN